MESLPEIASLQQQAEQLLGFATDWLRRNAFVVGNLIQVAILLATYLIARLSVRPFVLWARKAGAGGHPYQQAIEVGLRVLLPLMLPVIWLVFLWLSVFVAGYLGWSSVLLRLVVSLLTAWVVIRLMSGAIGNPAWSKFIAVGVWTIAALNSVGWLTPVTRFLDSLAIDVGDVRLSLLGLIKALVALAVFLWMAGALTRLIESRIGKVSGLSPSARVLFGKLSKMLLYTLAILVGLRSVGIDLTAFAVFTGAVGLGIGFGLQKIFSNLISGIILLVDKSVKPGDVIAIGNTYGTISSLGARYVSVNTRAGKEHLIPNEELISQRVESWSHTNTDLRVTVPFGVSYASDLRKAMALAIQAAKAEARVLRDPEPVCFLASFADSSVNMELGFWIRDPENGISNIRSAVMLRLWDLFHEQGVEFPFPQRDFNLKPTAPLEVKVLNPTP
jgi:small-conductance mechanosensitive channel